LKNLKIFFEITNYFGYKKTFLFFIAGSSLHVIASLFLPVIVSPFLPVIARSEATKQSLTAVRHCEPQGLASVLA
jgi:hypothetical protein